MLVECSVLLAIGLLAHFIDTTVNGACMCPGIFSTVRIWSFGPRKDLKRSKIKIKGLPITIGASWRVHNCLWSYHESGRDTRGIVEPSITLFHEGYGVEMLISVLVSEEVKNCLLTHQCTKV